MSDEQQQTESNQAKENILYHQTLMEGLHDLYNEAAQDGILKQAEDLIDVLWASIPTGDKRKIKVFDLKGERIPGLDAWAEAKEILPPQIGEMYRKGKNSVEMNERDYPIHIKNKERTSRKLQIWTDVVFELGFLYKHQPFMMAHPDIEDVKKWEEAESNEPNGSCEGLAGSKDKEKADQEG
jgi:hypothetical protein